MDQLQSNKQAVDQQALDLGTQMAPIANPVMKGVDAISPVIEYLLQMLGQQQKQPAPSTTSQQTGAYTGPTYNPATGGLKQNIMGR